MTDAQEYMDTIRKQLHAWDSLGEDFRQKVKIQGMRADDGVRGDLFRLGILTLDLLHTREISISKLCIENEEAHV